MCPCCTLIAKVYPRKVTSSMARVLIRMAQRDDDVSGEYVNVTLSLRQNPMGTASQSGEWATLKYWGLIEGHPEENLWRITYQGLAFARGFSTIPKRLKVFNDSVLEILDPTPVSIRECLGKRFRLEDLYEGLGSGIAENDQDEDEDQQTG